ncbi:MAG TPA: hypothetical protein VFF76_03620 [Holophagaceae bacterium]|jgi:hypothetical protein|nr:hypothetical protein [Holophagaceae bacterium]
MKSILSRLPFVLAAPALVAQGAGLQGGGTLMIGAERYRFEPDSLRASKSEDPQKRALQIRGRLISSDPSKTLDLELIALDARTIYRLDLVHREADTEKERWAATLKTRLQVEAPASPGAGDRATFRISGPLVGIVEGLPRHVVWSGTFWAAFSVERVP